MQIYHGSNVIVEHPVILTNGFYKDFGYGFYCTNIVRQAERWAMSRPRASVVSIYEYTANNSLKIKQFDKMTDDWLNMIVDCRHGIEHSYDIVEGPMADDTIWDYVEDYVNGNITKEAVWELVKFRYPTHQIVFCTQAGLSTIQYVRSYSL